MTDRSDILVEMTSCPDKVACAGPRSLRHVVPPIRPARKGFPNGTCQALPYAVKPLVRATVPHRHVLYGCHLIHSKNLISSCSHLPRGSREISACLLMLFPQLGKHYVCIGGPPL